MACARRLLDARRRFLLITRDIGGRIRRSRDGALNLGAYYVREDYIHVKQFVTLGRSLRELPTLRHGPDGAYSVWDRRLLFHLPQAVRFMQLLRTFRRHYEALKGNCVSMSQRRAIRSDPYLWSLYRRPAAGWIREHGLRDIARDYLAPALHGTAFLPLERLTAFTLLLGALPAIVPTYEYTFRMGALLDGFEDSILLDAVTGLAREAERYRVRTRTSGAFAADRVVVATPVHVAKRLLGLKRVRRPVQAHAFEVRGTLRRPWGDAEINLFSEDAPTLAIARQADGTVLFCSQHGRPDFTRFFQSWEVVEHKHWDPAFSLEGDPMLECEQGPNLYLIGDHNVCGLEDAYITGLYAANQIISTDGRAPDAARASLSAGSQRPDSEVPGDPGSLDLGRARRPLGSMSG